MAKNTAYPRVCSTSGWIKWFHACTNMHAHIAQSCNTIQGGCEMQQVINVTCTTWHDMVQTDFASSIVTCHILVDKHGRWKKRDGTSAMRLYRCWLESGAASAHEPTCTAPLCMFVHAHACASCVSHSMHDTTKRAEPCIPIPQTCTCTCIFVCMPFVHHGRTLETTPP